MPPETLTTFGSLTLSNPLTRALQEMGFEEPTPVQAQAVPLLMAGRDVVAQALTGTGKTAAFGIPMVESIDPSRHVVQGVVLAPTRELAVQVAEHLALLGRYRDLRVVAIYGGQPIDRQLRALRQGMHVVVATPGRLLDHMRRGSLNLENVRMLVLDEADQMLQMGFQEDVEYVVSHLPAERTTALFSATMPRVILDIVHKYMDKPEMLHLSSSNALTVPEVEQVFYEVPFPRKFEALCRVLDARQPDRAVVFCATKRMVDEAVERLIARGYQANGLHSDINQAGRERILGSFRDGRTEVLVATDVAARGLDVPDVSLVVNFDIPPDPEYYVHRIGRTGRVGRGGVAITFVNPREMPELRMIERATGAKIRRAEVPTAQEAEQREVQLLEERLLDVLAKGNLMAYRLVVEELVDDHDPIDIAAAALLLAAGKSPTKRKVSTHPADKRDAEQALQREQQQQRPADRGGPWKGHKTKKRLPGAYAPPGKPPFSKGAARKGPRTYRP